MSPASPLAPSASRLTCWSCEHYRPDHCALGRMIWPHGGPAPRCADFCYEPGSDEAERPDRDTLSPQPFPDLCP